MDLHSVNYKNFIYTEVDSVIILETGFHTALLALNLLPSEAGLELVILLPPASQVPRLYRFLPLCLAIN